jgi:fatty acid desaturase
MAVFTPLATGRRAHVEWPTLLLLALTYLGWGAVTMLAGAIGPWLAVPMVAILLAQHASLQHEAIHGHPTGIPWVNEALVFPALGLFFPYRRFRDLHLAHHYDPLLTDPHDDPESNYLDPAVWSQLRRPVRLILAANNTLLGRMAIGPFVGMFRLWRDDLRGLRAGDRAVAEAWALHLAGLAPVVMWLAFVGRMPASEYLLGCWLALSILRIRTFLEHQAHEQAAGRSVIIEDRGPLSILFLNNNFHAVHHANPRLAWYRVPAEYARRREEWQRRNGGYSYRSYGEVFARYLLRRKDPVAHPIWTPPEPGRPRAPHPVSGRPLRP